MNRIRVKICGITTPEGIDAAVENGADAIGFVFAVSPRRVDSRSAARLAWRVPALVNRVGVFDERAHGVAELIREVPLSAVQAPIEVLGMISEFTNPGSIIPMFRDGEDLGERLDRYVRDGRLTHAVLVEGARSGEGVRADWSRIAKAAIGVRVILAGGLTPENVAEAIETVRPYAVDVSSGVESSPGVKDPVKVRDFLQAVRGVERRLA